MASHIAPSMLTRYLTKAAQSFPDKLALSAGKFEISYSRLQELIDQSASVLQSVGVSPGDVVALPFPNSIEMVIMFQAVMRARGVAAPLDPAYTQEGLEVYLSVSKSKLLLTDSNGYPPAQAAASKLGITQVTVSLPDPTGPVHISVPTLNGDSTHGPVHDFSNDPSDGALLLNNSGTTSRPKVITLTQHNLAVLVQSIASVCRMTESDSTVVVLPMFYVHGLLAGILSPLSAGGSVTLASLGQFSASTFWGDMHKPGSVDKPVGQELAVLDDKRVPQPTGVTGEVCIRGPNVTKGYKNNPEANEAAFLFGWLHTGDLGYLDEDGYLHLVGRVKELINNGGSFQDHITIDVELEVPAVDHEVGFDNQTSLSESLEQNTGSLGDIADPTSGLNRPNWIWHLWYVTACNFVSNTTVGVLYLGKNLQGSHETYQRAELIASVAAPIAVAVGTFVASIRFASNPGRWSNWITGLSIINAGMTVGGPLSFNSVRNSGI